MVWSWRYRSDTFSVGQPDLTAGQAPAVNYFDVAFQFRPSDNVIWFAGVDNLTDVQVPSVALAPRIFFTEFFDPVGRRFFAGIKAEF